jgi:stage V sporulation protein SpoVS
MSGRSAGIHTEVAIAADAPAKAAGALAEALREAGVETSIVTGEPLQKGPAGPEAVWIHLIIDGAFAAIGAAAVTTALSAIKTAAQKLWSVYREHGRELPTVEIRIEQFGHPNVIYIVPPYYPGSIDAIPGHYARDHAPGADRMWHPQAGWEDVDERGARLRTRGLEEPDRYHFLEADAPTEVRRLIARLARPAWEGLSDPQECTTATAVWDRLIRAMGHPCQVLGATLDNRSFRGPGGYRLHGGTLLAHLFLAVGPQLTLFDPTGLQRTIRDDGGPDLGRYIESSPGGQDVHFIDWREKALASPPGKSDF